MKIRTSQPVMADRDKTMRKIADFWNKTSEGWRAIWGPHIHHGFYEHTDQITVTPIEAQEHLIEKLAKMICISPRDKILDAGCGMGGSSLYLAKKFGAHVYGITLSHKQMAIARECARATDIQHVTFTLEDALVMKSFVDESIHVLWSLESCEQFYDKSLFFRQAARVLKPGGTLMLATWCSDQEEYDGRQAKQYRKLCRAFDLPYMPTLDHYRKLLEQAGFQLSLCEDWSSYVMKSWEIGLSHVHDFSFLSLWKLGGLRGLRFLKQARLMQEAFRQHRVRYGVFIARKPV
ncbi:2-methyl-6-phytyl-1,4-hydroquinone methyltransferase [Aquicella siphonis]|uniref:2-methyl-6-phytyl-1,4-hydroquinone methyltransferase n=1 Tax=Aquicella siphonis TaxID=254247 RepID=A0A5E4PDR5_9COXI|nr:methyltransferase domain-containing protein [Aquicella siphonis]VVC74934.1 2-methyl-6-phytyl-1,4-hydroquinone methyltransferase [Aquicella siphonis]